MAIADRIRRGMENGDTPPSTDPDVLAGFFSALSRGLVVQARDGAPFERLRDIVELGMRAWPDRAGRKRSIRTA